MKAAVLLLVVAVLGGCEAIDKFGRFHVASDGGNNSPDMQEPADGGVCTFGSPFGSCVFAP